MSKWYEVALAVDARDVDVIINDIKKMEYKPKEFFDETPDELYIVYYWDLTPWEGDAVESLLKKLEGMRHALYTISEDDEVWKDIEVSDSWGIDEQFMELLEIDAKIKMFGDQKALVEKAKSSIDCVAKIVIDLSEWSTNFPTGAIAYMNSGNVLSDYCDSTEEFLTFLRKCAPGITKYTDLKFVLESDSIENCMDTVDAIRKEFEYLKPNEVEKEA